MFGTLYVDNSTFTRPLGPKTLLHANNVVVLQSTPEGLTHSTTYHIYNCQTNIWNLLLI
jgi:hypothetical protein